jgi:hypothetical protein
VCFAKTYADSRRGAINTAEIAAAQADINLRNIRAALVRRDFSP